MEFGAGHYYILGEVITCAMSALLCINILLTFSAYDRRQRLFLYAGISTFLSAFFDICAVLCITYYTTVPVVVSKLVSTLFFVFLIFTPFAMANYVVDVTYPLARHKFFGYVTNGFLYVLFFTVVILNWKTGWIFSYSASQGYVRGPLRYLTYVMTAFYCACIIFSVIINRRLIARRIFMVFIAYPIICAVFVIFQFFRPHIIFNGIASFSSVYFAYMVIQTYLIEVDIGTGLMVESKLKKRIAVQKRGGVLYVLSIENMNLIRASMDYSELGQFFVALGQFFNLHFPHDSYHISTHRFAAIGRNMSEVQEKSAIISKYAENLVSGINPYFHIPINICAVAMNFARDENDYEVLMDIMNNMILKAKSSQTRSLMVCDEAVLVERERKRYIYHILRRELNFDSEQFQVWYQPIYSIADKHFTYMEALSRLRNTELGNISPQEFVQVAESRGLIERLGSVAFEKTCKFISDNRDVVKAVSVNFSAYQMTNPDLVQNVLSTLERYSLKPENIIMEITESIFIDNYDLVREHMIQLSRMGVKFYLDDFGTGYSNLSNVVALPFSTIKMDRSLVMMMEESERGVKLFTNLVSTFKGAELKVLVEGVETNNQNALVESVGVDYIQGFLYSRPLEPSACVELLRKDKADAED